MEIFFANLNASPPLDIVTAVGILFVCLQLLLAKRAMSHDHERSRRQFAIEIARDWNRSIGPETSAAQKLIQGLNEDQCNKIAKYESPVIIEKGKGYLVDVCLETPACRDQQGSIILDDADVKHLRYLGANYLNEIEIVLSAWYKNVGDQDYIEEEFSFVTRNMTMDRFRDAIGAGDYPAIDSFLSRNARSSSGPLGRLLPFLR